MKQTTDVTRTQPKKRTGILPGSVMLSFAFIVGACSSDNATVAPTTESSGGTQGSAELAPTTAPDVDAFLDQLETGGFGGVVAVRNGSETTIRAYGTADRENDVPIDTETVFDIGSVTKQFTSAAILRLEMDGRLSVDDTLGEHLPDLPADKAAITLHQLLTHTAGVPNNFGPDDQPVDRSDFLALFIETPLTSAPGDRHEYSNVGTALLAAVIEFETGEPYEAYLRTALFEPAGMLDTGYVLPNWDGHTIAVGYDNPSGDRFGRPNERPWDVNGPYWNLHGNGGILSTAADMLRWDEVLLGERVLDTTAKAKFFAPHVPDGPDEDSHYGYGWCIVPTPMGTPLITHNGGNGTFYADFLRFVEQDVTIFVVTNSYRVDDGIIAYEAANHMLDGALTPMLGGDTDAGVDPCDFGELSIDSLPDHPEINALPDTPAGRTTTIFLALLANGDDAARLDFATDLVSEQFGGGEPSVVADGLLGLQAQFADYEVVRIMEQEGGRFHVFMQGPETELLISVSFEETDPERLACVAVST